MSPDEMRELSAKVRAAGLAIVPREATEAMVEAADRIWDQRPKGYYPTNQTIAWYYAAMVEEADPAGLGKKRGDE